MVKDCKDLAFRRNVCSGRPDLIGSLGPRHILQKQEKLKFTTSKQHISNKKKFVFKAQAWFTIWSRNEGRRFESRHSCYRAFQKKLNTTYWTNGLHASNKSWSRNMLKLPGPQPVMVSGFGMSPSWHRQIGLPKGLGEQVVPGPQGDGLHGSTGLALKNMLVSYKG